jgi:hypothetical protein
MSYKESSSQDKQYDIQFLEDAETVSSFGEHWDEFFARAVDAPPFLSRPWISTYIEEGWIKGTPLFILAWYRTKLVAMFSLDVRKYLGTKIAMPISMCKGFLPGIITRSELSISH